VIDNLPAISSSAIYIAFLSFYQYIHANKMTCVLLLCCAAFPSVPPTTAGGVEGSIVVALLQLPENGGVEALSIQAHEAAHRGSELLLLPASYFAASVSIVQTIVPLCRELGVAMMGTGWTTNGQDNAVLVDRTGTLILNHTSVRVVLPPASGSGSVDAAKTLAESKQQNPDFKGSTATNGLAWPAGTTLDCGSSFQVAQLQLQLNRTVGIGMLLNREWECFQGPRALMLGGVDLVVVGGGSYGGSNVYGGGGDNAGNTAAPTFQKEHQGATALSVAATMALYTRAWENVVGIALTNPAEVGGSQAYLGVKGTSNGIGVTLLKPTATGAAVHLVSFDLVGLQSNRSRAIWGDAFRRPYAYRPLCGLGADGASSGADGASSGAGRPFQPLQQPKLEDDGKHHDRHHLRQHPQPPQPSQPPQLPQPQRALSVALLQLAPKENEVDLAAHAEKKVREAAMGGADIVVMPEM
jgi:predicted amidohydrolase